MKNQRVSVYVASKTYLAEFWLELRATWTEVFICSSWIDMIIAAKPETKRNAESFWIGDIEQVLASDALLVFANEDDILQGALIEVGAALSHNIPVLAVGDVRGTWQFHPGVRRCASLEEAYEILRKL